MLVVLSYPQLEVETVVEVLTVPFSCLSQQFFRLGLSLFNQPHDGVPTLESTSYIWHILNINL